jgi:hypothetical protein
MRIYGYLKQIVEVWFRKNNQDIKVTPNAGTYTGPTTISLPPVLTGSDTLVSTTSNETLLNKTTVSSTNLATGALKLPSGTTAEQPASPATGMIRYNSSTVSFEGYNNGSWSSIGGGGVTDQVTQTAHGFTVGDTLYLSGGTYAKAIATAANTAEVAGVVSRVISANTFEITLSGEVTGLSGLTVGEAYFLSAVTPGLLSLTEPTTIGHVSVPVGIASSATSLYVAPKRGAVIGGTNARTELALTNNASTAIYSAPSGVDAGEISGWVFVNATSSSRFFLNAQIAKNGAGTDWNVSYQVSGDTPPVGFSVTVSSVGVVSITLPNVTGFSSAKVNYSLNASAVGATFPLSVDASTITAGTVAAARLPVVVPGTSNGVVSSLGLPGRTDGTAIASGYVGQTVTNLATSGISTSASTLTSISVPAGVWLISSSSYIGGDSTARYIISAIDTNAGGLGSATDGTQTYIDYNTSAGVGTARVSDTYWIFSSTTTVYLRGAVGSTSGISSQAHFIRAIRIA